MSTITSSTSSSNGAATYAAILAAAQKTAKATATTTTTSGSQSSATNLTLSDAAKAALALKDFTTVIADARATLDQLLADAKVQSPLKDGALTIDLSKVDRRELFAISTNSGQKFTADEQKSAAIELQNRFDQALAGPTAVGRVTGSIKGLYTAALAYYDQMGPEEKASAAYADQRAALESMLTQLSSNPKTLPVVDNDPVAAYMTRLSAGETGQPRAIADVGNDARSTLDAQYAAGASLADYTDFDSRSLAAVALNTGGNFTATEVRNASSEMRSRSGAALLAGLKNSGTSSDPAAFASNIISLYGAMSSEERAAAGWSDKLYESAVANYQTATKLASMLGSTTGSSVWGGSNETTSSSSSSSNTMSILNYL
ncbi:hypothetical protein [Devosia sp.]|uniref:hypothetical protein n=1 Tax=Devosia sp. TaxID=1871048 RepID=UPI003BAC743E